MLFRSLRRARLQMPDDMSILGFDGLAMGELLSPPLASVCAPNREIGCAAWRRLIARVDGSQPSGFDDALHAPSLSLTLPHMLREGATVAAISDTSGVTSSRIV